ncbi:MAG: hypothetical protein C0621_05245 [Desulfuromonas sp.]|nr:MAG: hypothetical protein C0621_05245 [Desulfuromonas sp.]
MLKHITTCLIAGIVVSLPVGGTILIVGALESSISTAGLDRLPFYVPGLGLLLAFVALYLLGLLTSTLIGQWIWKRIDRLFERLPALGRLYVSLKQILGYGEGEEAVFHEVVLVADPQRNAHELGLVTRRYMNEAGEEQAVVFIPGAPTPTNGRMLLLPADQFTPTTMSVHDALKALVTLGKTDIPQTPPAP